MMPDELKPIFEHFNGDMRACLLAIQFWISHQKYPPFLSSNPPTLPLPLREDEKDTSPPVLHKTNVETVNVLSLSLPSSKDGKVPISTLESLVYGGANERSKLSSKLSMRATDSNSLGNLVYRRFPRIFEISCNSENEEKGNAKKGSFWDNAVLLPHPMRAKWVEKPAKTAAKRVISSILAKITGKSIPFEEDNEVPFSAPTWAREKVEKCSEGVPISLSRWSQMLDALAIEDVLSSRHGSTLTVKPSLQRICLFHLRASIL